MEFSVNILITIIGVLIGAAIAWGALREIVKRHTKQVDKLTKSWNAFHGQSTEQPGSEPMYIRRTECEEKSESIVESVEALADTVAVQGSSIERLVNHARWQLTTKEGMSLAEANNILENGN